MVLLYYRDEGGPKSISTLITHINSARCVSALMGLVTLIFDLLTLKLVCESHLRWGTFVPNLGTLGFWVLELFATYATDGQRNRRMDGQKQTLIAPFPPRTKHNMDANFTHFCLT